MSEGGGVIAGEAVARGPPITPDTTASTDRICSMASSRDPATRLGSQNENVCPFSNVALSSRSATTRTLSIRSRGAGGL